MAGPFERDPQDPPPVSRLADPTRDIRLPPLPGRPSPELPPEWERLRSEREASAITPPPDAAISAPQDPGAPGATPPDTAVPMAGAPAGGSADASPDTLADQPTDQLGQPRRSPGDRTLTFRGTAAERWAAGHPATPDPAWSSVPPGPAPVVAPRRRSNGTSRRWPWIVLTLVPVLVIVVTGVWLLLLMRSG